MPLQGASQLRARMRALSTVGKPIAEEWGRGTADAAKGMVPVRTGALQRSIHPGDADSDGGTVLSNRSGIYVDRGTNRHTITPGNAETLAFKLGGRSVFSKRVSHPGGKPRPFAQRAAVEGMRRTSMKEKAINAWNRAA